MLKVFCILRGKNFEHYKLDITNSVFDFSYPFLLHTVTMKFNNKLCGLVILFLNTETV